jgi:hypothetical protein
VTREELLELWKRFEKEPAGQAEKRFIHWREAREATHDFCIINHLDEIETIRELRREAVNA